MTPIRLIVAGLPTLLGEIVAALAAEREPLVIVAELEDEADLVATVKRLKPDVVVLPESAADPRLGEAILLVNPRLATVLMSEDARTARMHRLLPDRRKIDDLSPEALFDALAEAHAGPAGGWWP